jgi:peptide-methionine (S)-S-oxide reductase
MKFEEFFYRSHDPTTVNRQGTSIGTRNTLIVLRLDNADIISIEYRSVIFTTSDAQAVSAKLVTEEIQAKHFTPDGKCFLSVIWIFRSTLIYHRFSFLLGTNINFFTGKKIVTEIITAGQWWNAEDYHQLYLYKNPSGKKCPTHVLHW